MPLTYIDVLCVNNILIYVNIMCRMMLRHDFVIWDADTGSYGPNICNRFYINSPLQDPLQDQIHVLHSAVSWFYNCLCFENSYTQAFISIHTTQQLVNSQSVSQSVQICS